MVGIAIILLLAVSAIERSLRELQSSWLSQQFWLVTIIVTCSVLFCSRKAGNFQSSSTPQYIFPHSKRGDPQFCRYEGSIRQNGSEVVIGGSFANKSDEKGNFECTMHPLSAGGYFVGFSVPDNSLADFMIPTNPIFWGLNLVSDECGSESPSVFGAGCFFDAGDVEVSILKIHFF